MRVSSRELSEWVAYFKLDPWGEERSDVRMAMILTMLANIYRDRKKKKEPYEYEDFMPKTKGAPPDYRKMLRKVESIVQVFGGKDNRDT